MQHAILTLVRHAETTANLNRLLQGVTDSPLTVFGQAQVDALARTWATTRRSDVSSTSESGASLPISTSPVSKLDLPPPTLIVCSPIGRARKTAEAIHRACSHAASSSAQVLQDALDQPGATRLAVSRKLHEQSGLALLVDAGLAEKDFGWKESTRGGLHVAGYPKGKGNGESRTDFAQRVRCVGAEWLEAACSRALASSEHLDPGEATTEAQIPQIPHIVLVSHGMWISTLLSMHPPTTISQTSAQPGFLPFAANTGMFSLKVQPRASELPASDPASAARPVTDLFRANDVRHLEHVKRQKGGIGRGAFDSKQTKLSAFFASSTASPPSSPRRLDPQQVESHTPSAQGSPTKKRRL